MTPLEQLLTILATLLSEAGNNFPRQVVLSIEDLQRLIELAARAGVKEKENEKTK